ncbi:MAG: hypothetical protein ACD_8C00060G0001 [uncultured bacterium]|nr:MAG: hypothetical protein ACD_8C00060G0001 [uncultured bacterium]
MTIQEITKKYTGKIDYFDLELIIAHSLGKTREFVLTYPNQTITKIQETKIKKNVARRAKSEPIAHIFGHKEFYGLDFIVSKHTLVPRPETELMVELALSESKVESQKSKVAITVIDVGTGSGCIIVSIANELEKTEDCKLQVANYYATDISKDALKIAKKNAKLNSVDKKIKFLHGSLLEPMFSKIKKLKSEKLIILANLPYLSKEIYSSAPIDVKKFEPRSALYSPEAGLKHYRELLEQIKKIQIISKQLLVVTFLEFSPEQKTSLGKLIKDVLPKAKATFTKDLSGKWRICKIFF